MPQQKTQTSHNIPVWGILLLFLGIVFLLQNLKVLPWGLWGILWRFWPVVIITFGLGMLLRRFNPWLISGLVLLLFSLCLGVAIWQYGLSPAPVASRSYTTPLGSLTSARVEIDFSAGSLTLGSLSPSSPNLVEAVSESEDGSNIQANLQSQGSEGKLRLTTEKVNREFWSKTDWKANFTRSIPLTMYLKSAVGDLDLNLSELAITDLQMDLNAGNCIVKMPSPADKTSVYINADVANLEITIPRGIATRIKAGVKLSNLQVDTFRFPKKGDYYVSDGFATAPNRLDIELNCNIGRVEVK